MNQRSSLNDIEDEIRQAATAFSPVWDALAPREQHRLVDLVVQRVDYHGGSNKIVITFHETGIKSLASEQEDAA